MPISVNSPSFIPDITQGAGLAMVKIAKQAQIEEGNIALRLIQSAELKPDVSSPQPEGSLGHHIDIKA